MSTNKHWFKKADEAPAVEPPTRPLSEVDQERPAPAAQPTAAPQPAEPIPMNELLKQFENAAKALYDAGLNMEKANVAIHKITSSGGRTPAEQGVISKAESLISQIESAQAMVGKIADEATAYRGSLGENKAASSSGWIK
jgi:hypothetical protein